jgi:Uma2 family endonuclease
MSIATTFPLTRLDLAALAGDRLMRFPATEAEYWELLAEAEYSADFYQKEIIAMSYETDRHSDLVTEILYILKKIFPKPNKHYKIHDPNRPICIKDCENAIFCPDASVVTQPPEYYEYRPGMNAETTPVILVEVLSKNTRDYDLAEKLPCYKKIPSIRQIIYADSQKPHITVYDRIENSRQWLNTDYDKQEDTFLIHNTPVSLQSVYQDVFF